MEENVNLPAHVVFKRKAAWDGIRLEHVRLNAGELPKHRHHEHTILISLSEGCRGELATPSGGMRGTRTKGSVCVLPSRLEHQATLEDESEHLALYLDPSVIVHAASDASLSGNFELVERYAPQDPVISNVGMALLGELNSRASVVVCMPSRCQTFLRFICYATTHTKTQRHLVFTADYRGKNFDKLMTSLQTIRERHQASRVGPGCRMSNFHFAREFKRTTGTSPHQYLIKFRVERAKALLTDDGLPLTEVGLRSGFSHQSHFTRLFRKITGTTPHLYRLGLQTKASLVNR